MKAYNLKWITGIFWGIASAFTCGGQLMAQTVGVTGGNTYSNDLGKATKAAPTIKIDYPKLTPGYACAGDTILVTATADNIDDLVLPSGSHWAGEENAVSRTGTSVSKRFFTYHPYLETDPTSEKPKEFSFTVRLIDQTETRITQTIAAKSCPPTINTPKLTSSTINNKYNLGYIAFEFSFPNQTTQQTSTQFSPIINPPQPFHLFLARRSASNNLEIRYRSIPTSDARYDIDVVYNEGDSTRTRSFGPYEFQVTPLDDVVADKSAYCSGEDIEFTLTLADEYDKILRQTADINKPDEIAACFDWSRSPSEVKFTGQQDNRYFFSTKAAGASDEYHCIMSVVLKYQSTLSRPVIDTSIQVSYDMPITAFTYHSSAAFTQKEEAGCEGGTIDLSKFLPAGLTIVGYNTLSPGPSFSPGSSFTVSAKSGTVYAKLKANFHCDFMGADNTFIDSIKINVTPLPEISSISIAQDTLICEGEALFLSATTNPEAKAAVTWIKTTDGSGNAEPIGPGSLVLSDDATITTIATNLCGSSAPSSFKVRVGKRPAISFTPSDMVRACPYTSVSLNGSGGTRHSYRLYNLHNNQAVTFPQFGDQTGVQNYPLQLHDSLGLIYTAENMTTANGFHPASLSCPASDTARIIAYPAPEVSVSYDGQTSPDGSLCVPRDQQFNLVASGADTYVWQTSPTSNGATLGLTLDKDGSISVRGIENRNKCYDTYTVQCIVSVEHANRVTSATVCPGESVCFEADNLPDTKYAWFGADGKDLGHSTERYCINPTIAGQEGTYTLKTERNGCSENLPYKLVFHPYPSPKIITVSPEICEGSNVVLQVYSGMSETDEALATFRWEKADGSFISDRPNIQIPNIQKENAGLYRAFITSQAGCKDEDTLTLTVGTHITPVFRIEPSYCEGDAEILTTTTTGSGYTYRWFTDGRVISTDESEPTVPTTWLRMDNGTLHLEIKQTGCIDIASEPLTVIPRPHLSDMPKDTGICDGMPFCIHPVSDITPDKVVWSFIGRDGMMTVLRQDADPDLAYCWDRVDSLLNGRYFIDVWHQGCLSVSDTMQFTVHPLPDIRVVGPDFICDSSIVTLTAVSQTPGTYRWPHSGETAEVIQVEQAGRYAVIRTSEYGCVDSADIRLEARPLPYFSLPADTSICRGTSFMIYGPDNMDAYLWNDGLDEKDRLAEDEGWYVLTVFRNECGFSDSLHVHLSFCGQFHFPTAFTPNDNQVNDTWGAISAAKDEDMAEYDLMVFDRNGKKVFHGKRISEQWDGKYKGQLCPPGVYTYSFRALEKEEGIKYQASGTVTIVL